MTFTDEERELLEEIVLSHNTRFLGSLKPNVEDWCGRAIDTDKEGWDLISHICETVPLEEVPLHLHHEYTGYVLVMQWRLRIGR